MTLRSRNERAVDSLLTSARIAATGYADLSHATQDPELQQRFRSLADERERLVDTIEAECKGHDIPVPGSDPDRRAVRAVAQAARSVTGLDALLREQKQREQRCIESARSQLNNRSPWLRSIAENHLDTAQAALEQLSGITAAARCC